MRDATARASWTISAMMFVVATTVSAQPEGGARLPVFDVHLHALAADAQGPPPLGMCTPVRLPTWDPQRPYAETFLSVFKEPACDDPIWSPMDDEELLRRTLDELEEHHVFGVLSADLERGRAWAEAAPGRFVRGLGFNLAAAPPPPDELRRLVEAGEVEVLSEVTNQYSGIAPDDPRMEPYWALAEELDLPVGIHVGTGPPGSPYLGSPGYRAAAHSALTMEPVLARHPKLRVYLMHAGYPLLEDLLALLYTHPQVHVGIGVIVYTQPREAFYRFLRGIVEAGFAKRVMFGSDQMVWPEVIGRSIRVIEEAPFLSAEQKRDILYGNAARFFRFDEEEIARHHGRGE